MRTARRRMMGTQQLFKDPDQEDDLFDEENTLALLDKQLAAQAVPVKDRACQIDILKWERRNIAVQGGPAGKVSNESVASGVEGESLGSVGAVVQRQRANSWARKERRAHSCKLRASQSSWVPASVGAAPMQAAEKCDSTGERCPHLNNARGSVSALLPESRCHKQL